MDGIPVLLVNQFRNNAEFSVINDDVITHAYLWHAISNFCCAFEKDLSTYIGYKYKGLAHELKLLNSSIIDISEIDISMYSHSLFLNMFFMGDLEE